MHFAASETSSVTVPGNLVSTSGPKTGVGESKSAASLADIAKKYLDSSSSGNTEKRTVSHLFQKACRRRFFPHEAVDFRQRS